MSECGVCIGSDDYDGEAEFHCVTLPKARKEHRCVECRRTIFAGEHYERNSMKWEGNISTIKTCSHCKEIRSAFNCGNAYVFGELWAEMREIVFPMFNTSCLDRLQTPDAKTYLQLQWMEWKGLGK